MRRWRCAPSTGISCARSGSSSSRWCISSDHDEPPTEPHRDRLRAARRRLPRPGAVVRHVCSLLRPERPDQPRHQLEHPLPHGGAVHHRHHGGRHPVLHESTRPRASPGRHHRPRQGRAAPAPSGHGAGSSRRDAVSQAAVAEHDLGIEPAESPLTPESWGKLGMWVFLAADAMSFGGLFFILTGFHGCHVFGGVTYRSAVLGRSVRGVVGAVVTAAVAVACTLGLIVVTSATLSGLVAVIAAAAGAGVVLLTANLLAGGTPVYDAHNNNEVDIAALYWHFVDLIWILVFTFVYLI